MSTLPPRPTADPIAFVAEGLRPARAGTVAHGAFWIMVRRVTVAAACVDLAFLVLFLLLDAPLLAWLNIGSIALYACAHWLLTRRRNTAALALIWTEVLIHAAIGSMLIGWDSGFHYYLLMFIPAIAVSRSRTGLVLLLGLLAFYLGLHAASQHFGVLQPLSSAGLSGVHAFNVAIVFAMASYTARFYYATVRRAERRLVDMATRDPLTGLANRRHWLALAQHEVARSARTHEPLALVMADIDHFKRVNDARGHDVGDQTLRHVAATLAELCRGQDVIARWGGEEFLLLLPMTSAQAAHTMAERLRTRIAETPVPGIAPAVSVTLSLGVALWQPTETLEQAIGRADAALYQSKQTGRNRVCLA